MRRTASAISERADHLAMVAQFRDRETDHGQTRDGPNPENARNTCTNSILIADDL